MTKLAKAKSEAKWQQRRETCTARKRRREEADLSEGEDDLNALSEEQLGGEEVAGDPTESEADTALARVAPSASGQALAKKCAVGKGEIYSRIVNSTILGFIQQLAGVCS